MGRQRGSGYEVRPVGRGPQGRDYVLGVVGQGPQGQADGVGATGLESMGLGRTKTYSIGLILSNFLKLNRYFSLRDF